MAYNNENQFARTALLLGDEAMERLAQCRVIVMGVGGVGGHAVEVLARSGVGAIDVVDNDVVTITNLNRQLIALHSTIGRPKVDVIAERVADINPACKVTIHRMFYLPAVAGEIDLTQYDYVVDCIDTVAAKLELIHRAIAAGVPVISSMGAAYKMDATQLRIVDIAQTAIDPLARIVRKRLRHEGIEHFKCVCSSEDPIILDDVPIDDNGKRCPASNAWVPATAGLLIGSEVIKDLASWTTTH